MPQVGNKCPGKEEYHRFDSGYCLNTCRQQCMPASVLVHIESRLRMDKHIGQYISATSLLGCLRQLYGERTLDYYVEPRKSWYSLRGTLLHNILEKPGMLAQLDDMRRYVRKTAKLATTEQEEAIKAQWATLEAGLFSLAEMLPSNDIPDWESETEYEFPLGTINGKERFLRGTIDVLRPESHQIYDYKTMGDKGLPFLKNGAKEDHVLQFNIYRFLVERGYPVGKSYETYTPFIVENIVAFYMTMMQVVRTGDILTDITPWQREAPGGHPNLVGTPELLGSRIDRVLKKGKRKATAGPDDYEDSPKFKYRVNYRVPEVPLMDLDVIERLIHDNAALLIDAFDNGAMPPMCKPEMREWKCDDYCPDSIRQWCDAYNATVGESRITKALAEEDLPVVV